MRLPQARLEQVLDRFREIQARLDGAKVASDAFEQTGKVLWVAGQTSPYVKDEYVGAMDRWFPQNRKVTVKNAGHWVHSEQPEVFLEVLKRFLA